MFPPAAALMGLAIAVYYAFFVWRAKDLQRLCLVQPANLPITTASGRIACYVDDPHELARSMAEPIDEVTRRAPDKILYLVSNETLSRRTDSDDPI